MHGWILLLGKHLHAGKWFCACCIASGRIRPIQHVSQSAYPSLEAKAGGLFVPSRERKEKKNNFPTPAGEQVERERERDWKCPAG